ncbi:MAG TPA: DUF86 domain-containing protein [Nitrospirae bacterium]|nr:DUF86 domain-containing protein [Nitrospirota bacterium]
MPDRDVVLAKVAAIQRCLKRIKETTDLDPDSLDDIDKQDIFILNLQRAVQAAIDLATHIIASEGLGLSDTIKDNFKLLKNAGIINEQLTDRMESMAGFRNIAIHDYQAIDIDILKSILIKHLKDIEDFYTTVLLYFKFTT